MTEPANSSYDWKYLMYQPYKWLVFLPLMIVNSVLFATLAALCALLISANRKVSKGIFIPKWISKSGILK
jgi:hypothetical protein